MLIDPRISLMDEYREYLLSHDLRLEIIVDTHVHDDHYSASHLFQSSPHLMIAMSHLSTSARVGKRLAHLDKIQLGQLQFTVLETPGHSQDSISLYGEGILFSGDALWIGKPCSLTKSSNSELQQKTVREVFDPLPGSTVIFPSHDESELICSLIEVERVKNPLWKGACLDLSRAQDGIELVHGKKFLEFNDLLAPSGLPHESFRRDLSSEKSEDDIQIVNMSIEKFRNKLFEKREGSIYLDVREEEEFRASRIPGTRNIPLSEIGLHWPELSQYERIYVSCQTGRRGIRASRTLNYLGFLHVIHVNGGFSNWQSLGYELEKDK
jgi:glyoxylase-like metal-dependent hydrolase (beta-lactamase superfamily II)/rhodanese-related sulfurtransferase